MFKWTVTSEDNGSKLLAYIAKRVGNSMSLRSIKRAIESNHCIVNGRVERFASIPVGVGDVIEVDIKPTIQKTIFDASSNVIYEDPSFLIIDKPPGFSSEGSDLIIPIKKYCPSAILAHRIDKDTSGILIFAKSPEIFNNLVSIFRKQEIQKTYLTLVDGIPSKDSGMIDNYLGKILKYQGQALWGSVDKNKGLHAITEWKILKKGKNAALLVCFPKTGRTHQIRAHMAGLGHPILGDYQYGRTFKCPFKPTRHLLHASEIAFVHPLSKSFLHVQAPLPEDFALACKALEM